jgi:hypothetical protein
MEDNLLKLILICPAPTFEILLLFFNPAIKSLIDEGVHLNVDASANTEWFEEGSLCTRALALVRIQRVV